MSIHGGMGRMVVAIAMVIGVIVLDGWTGAPALEADDETTPPVVAGPRSDSAPSAAASAMAARMADDLGIDADEAATRLRRQPHVADLSSALEGLNAPWYGGTWIDHADGGRVKVAYVGGSVPTALPRLSLPPALVGLVDFVPVTYSLAQLRHVQAKIDALRTASGTMASSIVVDENRVTIGVDGGGEADPTYAAAVEEVADTLAPSVVIVDEPRGAPLSCADQTNCDSPLRGGIRIEAGSTCTAGFVAQDGLGVLYLLTAAHCGADGSTWRHGPAGKVIGTMAAPPSPTAIDARGVRVAEPWRWSPTNWVFGSPDPQWIDSTVWTSGITVGQYVCKFGQRTLFSCGSIIAVNESMFGQTGLFRVRACALAGDSGAPVFDAAINRAYGMAIIGQESGLCDSATYYHALPIRDIESNLRTSVLTRPGRTGRPMVKQQANHLMRDTLTQGSVEWSFVYGEAGDEPLYCDWDGNGTRTVGVYRPGNSWFYLRDSNSAGPANVASGFGNPGDRPLCGDWDGNGTETVGVWRNGRFYLSNWNVSPTANYEVAFGDPAGDLPVVGDWDRNGTDTIGVFRTCACAGRFYLRNSNASTYCCVDYQFNFGNGNDAPKIGDWNGDRRDTVGVTRLIGNDQWWYLDNGNDGSGTDVSFGYGAAIDQPAVWGA